MVAEVVVLLQDLGAAPVVVVVAIQKSPIYPSRRARRSHIQLAVEVLPVAAGVVAAVRAAIPIFVIQQLTVVAQAQLR